jgi:hypothetical protein
VTQSARNKKASIILNTGRGKMSMLSLTAIDKSIAALEKSKALTQYPADRHPALNREWLLAFAMILIIPVTIMLVDTVVWLLERGALL